MEASAVLLYVCLCLCCPLLSQVLAPFRPVSSSAPVVSGGAVVAERRPPVCEGELRGVSSLSVRLGWNRPCVFPLTHSLSVSGVQCFKLYNTTAVVCNKVYLTTHASHMLALIPCNTVRCGLVTVRSVQKDW